MMRFRTRTLGALALALALALPANAAVDVRLDRRDVAVGEPLTLILEARGAAEQGQPDLAALAPDFQILGVSRGTRTTLINGVRDHAVEWSVVVAPTRAGTLVVPALAVGAETTAPIAVEVAAAGTNAPPSSGRPARGTASPTSPPPELVFQSRVDGTEAFVQEQVVLTVRLESPVPLLEGQIAEPEIPGALVERLGEDHQETRRVAGHEVQVFERRYAVFPQRSGALEIAPFVFEGTTSVQPSARTRPRSRLPSRLQALMGGSLLDDPFFEDFFAGSAGILGDVGRRQSVRASTRPIALAVAPRPEQATGERWLPAHALEIAESWGDGGEQEPVLRVGEPIDRLLTIEARGVVATQLPQPRIEAVDGLKQYGQPVRLENREDAGDMVATLASARTLIPTRPGPLTLPPVEISWWDLEDGVSRVATLPERTLEVMPSADTGDIAVVPPIAGEGAPPADAVAPRQDVGPTVPSPSALLPWTIAIALVVAGLSWVAILVRRSHRSARWVGRVARRRARARAERALARACRREDAPSALAALAEIAACRWPGTTRTAGELAERVGDEALLGEVRLLLSCRYGAGEQTFSGAALWRAYRRTRSWRAHDARAHEDPLPTLYPASR
jgi:hypothetical protein